MSQNEGRKTVRRIGPTANWRGPWSPRWGAACASMVILAVAVTVVLRRQVVTDPERTIATSDPVTQQVNQDAGQAHNALTPEEEYQAAKQEALAPLQADWQRICEAGRDDSTFRKWLERLDLTDEATGCVLMGLKAVSTASVIDSANPAEADAIEPVTPERMRVTAPLSLHILREYGNAFAEKLALPASLPERDRRTVWHYASLSMGAAIAAVTQYATATGADLAPEALCLTAVLPLLNTPDAEWSHTAIKALPDGMNQEGNLAVLEDFALQAGRPLTAFWFSRHGSDTGEPSISARLAYLQTTARKLRDMSDFAGAMQCQEAGAELARVQGDTDALVVFLIEMSETLSTGSDDVEAAIRMVAAMEAYPAAEEYGRLVAFRLKYLYREGEFDGVWQEVQGSREDERCEGVLPELYYISWLTARQLNHGEQALQLKEDFVARWPEHPWCADMLFHSGLVACVHGDHGEMERLFALINSRYPGSKASSSVKKIEDRLQSRAKAEKEDFRVLWRKTLSLAPPAEATGGEEASANATALMAEAHSYDWNYCKTQGDSDLPRAVALYRKVLQANPNRQQRLHALWRIAELHVPSVARANGGKRDFAGAFVAYAELYRAAPPGSTVSARALLRCADRMLANRQPLDAIEFAAMVVLPPSGESRDSVLNPASDLSYEETRAVLGIARWNNPDGMRWIAVNGLAYAASDISDYLHDVAMEEVRARYVGTRFDEQAREKLVERTKSPNGPWLLPADFGQAGKPALE